MPSMFEYYYGDESEQFSYFRIPRLLITEENFKTLSTDAKLLYGLLLDRMGLSAKNGWYDKQGRVYIYYTLEEMQEDLGCGHNKAVRLMAELDTGKGCGLIERVKQGQGRPTIIYVKRFTTQQIPPQAQSAQDFLPPGSPDFPKEEVKNSQIGKSRVPKSGSADFPKQDGNYTKSNQTDSIQLDPSIYPPALTGRWIDRSDCREEIKRRIEYPLLCVQFDREELDEVVELLVDALCSTSPTIRIGGGDVPTAQVKERLFRLDSSHLEYVFDCLHRNTTQIRNIRAYLLTALYNAPATISHYYQAEVQHDFGL